MRLVDADELRKKAVPHTRGERAYCADIRKWAVLVGDIDDAPTIEQPTWIPVSERLPELHTKVLCCGTKGGRFIAELSEWGKGSLYWTKRDGKGCPKVTHWMPLPEPPKECET